jgi:hypothetical protein
LKARPSLHDDAAAKVFQLIQGSVDRQLIGKLSILFRRNFPSLGGLAEMIRDADAFPWNVRPSR